MSVVKAVLMGLVALWPAAALCQDQTGDQIVAEIWRKAYSWDLRVLNPDVRDELIQQLRKHSGDSFNPTNSTSRCGYFLMLRLGDIHAAKEVVKHVRMEIEGREILLLRDFVSRYGHPVVIPLIAEDFSKNDGDELLLADIPDIVFYNGPLSIEMVRITLYIVQDHGLFAPETQAWARRGIQLMDALPLSRTRELAQQWWDANEVHFRKGDYRAVRPGQELKSSVPIRAPRESSGRKR
jgi:hypothetical protein